MADQIVADLNAVLSSKKPTLVEIIQDFHKYVHNQDAVIAANITQVLDRFQPTSNFGRLHRIKLVNKYQVGGEVVKLIQGGDSLDVNQALKCSWFFTDISNPDSFAVDFIPNLSFSARLKVLNKYASLLANTKSADIIYGGLKSRYGTRIAVLILPACSENFIRSELPNIKITLAPGIVLSLFKKYPSLTTEYIKYLAEDSKKSVHLRSYEAVLVKLASKDLNTFLELTKKHKCDLPFLKLGRRPTKQILKTHDVVKDFENYEWLLKEKILFSRLSLDQIKQLYVNNYLPSNVSEFLSGARKAQGTLRHFKPLVQSDVILSTFKHKYGREMSADGILYNLEDVWVSYLPVEMRIKWLEKKILDKVSDAAGQSKYIAQLPVENSMPRLKQLIESQSDATVRRYIAKYMVETLKNNRCSAGIKDLLAYFVRRFRNETILFRSIIVMEMLGLEKLFVEVDDWTPILEFINIMKLAHEVYESYGIENAVRRILDYRVQSSFLKNGDVKGCLGDYLELATGNKNICNYEYLELCDGTPYRRSCLEWLLTVVPQMKWADPTFHLGFYARLYEHLVNFNVKNSESPIPYPGWLMDSINKMVDDKNAGIYNIMIISRTAKQADLELWRSITKRRALVYSFSSEMACEIIKFDPNFILKNILCIMETAVSCGLDSYSRFYKKIRLYEPFDIPSDVAKLCRVTLKLEAPEFDLTDDSTLASESSQPHAIGALAIILPSSEFLKIAEKFAPVSSKVEDYSKETQALHDIQKAIGKSFVNVTSAQDVLPIIQKFAVGDYLKFVAGSLPAICVRVPEVVVLPMLKKSINCPVSLRKHYLKLLYKVAPAEDRVQIFVNIFQKEKNISLRLVLFQLLRKAFIDEPDDDTYRTFQSILSQLTEEDLEALKDVFSIKQFEDSFIGQYLELIWKLTGSKWEAVLPKGKSDIVGLVTCCSIEFLPEDFCTELLSFELSKKLPKRYPSEFLNLYLLHAPSTDVLTARWAKVMASLEPLIKNGWDEYEFGSGPVFPARNIVSELVRTLCQSAPFHLNCSAIPQVQLLEKVKQTLARLIKPTAFLRESLALDLTITTLQHMCSNLPQSALISAVVDLYCSFLQTFSQYQHLVVKLLINYAPCDTESELAKALILNPNPTCKIIGIELLSSCVDKEEDITTYKTLIETLTASDDPTVQAAANNFFSTLTSSIV